MRSLCNIIEIGMYVTAGMCLVKGNVGVYASCFVIGLVISVIKKRWKI